MNFFKLNQYQSWCRKLLKHECDFIWLWGSTRKNTHAPCSARYLFLQEIIWWPVARKNPGLPCLNVLSFVLRWKAPCPGLQPQWGMVRGPNEERTRLGTQQLHHPGEQFGEAFLVSWTGVTERCRVPSEQWDQRQLSRAREREQSWPEIHLPAIRGKGVPLQNKHCVWRKGRMSKPWKKTLPVSWLYRIK